MPDLAIVKREPESAPPYAQDVRAGNYAIRVDMARIHQSTTWTLAAARENPPELPAVLLLLWCEAWQQIPCASLPADDAQVAALIRMPLSYLLLHRPLLMRGWKRCTDGRLYHDYLTGLVLTMQRERAKYARYNRTRTESTDPQDNHVVTTELPPNNDPARARVRDEVLSSDSLKTNTTTSQPPTDVDVDVKTTPTPTTAAAVAKRAAARALRGTRMQPDAQLPDAYRDWAIAVYRIAPQRAYQLWNEFRDYWADVPGERGLKLRWDGTWKNRLRDLQSKGKL